MKYFDSEGIQFSEVSAKEDTQETFRKLFKDKLRLQQRKQLRMKNNLSNKKKLNYKKEKKRKIEDVVDN